MPLPEDLTYVQVTGSVSDPAAVLLFKTPVWLVGDPTVPPFGLAATVDAEGDFSVMLPATDDPAWEPVDWTYQVEIFSDGYVLAGSLRSANAPCVAPSLSRSASWPPVPSASAR